mmetsp:Transcript_23940/g.36421  ORF Transcript_23940/g.36421 Transcript_23940/m.36421 type:complete len:115 (-) Transcript_23940:539-883(-)
MLLTVFEIYLNDFGWISLNSSQHNMHRQLRPLLPVRCKSKPYRLHHESGHNNPLLFDKNQFLGLPPLVQSISTHHYDQCIQPRKSNYFSSFFLKVPEKYVWVKVKHFIQFIFFD